MYSPRFEPDQLLSEGFKLGFARMDGHDVVHQAMLGEKLYAIIAEDAKAHKETYDGRNFDKVVTQIVSDKVRTDFFMASWETCRPHMIGGVVRLPTIITEWNGNDFDHYPAEYIEDFCLSTKFLKEFLRSNPQRRIPEGTDLGTHFMHETIRTLATNVYKDLPEGTASLGFIAEYAANNSSIARVLNNFGTTLGSLHDSAVLQLNEVTPEIWNREKVDLETHGVRFDAVSRDVLPNVFIRSWSSDGGHQRIVASFTEAISTFTGDPILRVQLTGNGNLPEHEKLKDVLASLLSTDDDIAITRIHVLNGKEIITALRELGATTRSLGTAADQATPMLPLITNLRNTPKAALGFEPTMAQKLILTEPLSHLFAGRPRSWLDQSVSSIPVDDSRLRLIS